MTGLDFANIKHESSKVEQTFVMNVMNSDEDGSLVC